MQACTGVVPELRIDAATRQDASRPYLSLIAENRGLRIGRGLSGSATLSRRSTAYADSAHPLLKLAINRSGKDVRSKVGEPALGIAAANAAGRARILQHRLFAVAVERLIPRRPHHGIDTALLLLITVQAGKVTVRIDRVDAKLPKRSKVGAVLIVLLLLKAERAL